MHEWVMPSFDKYDQIMFGDLFFGSCQYSGQIQLITVQSVFCLCINVTL